MGAGRSAKEKRHFAFFGNFLFKGTKNIRPQWPISEAVDAIWWEIERQHRQGAHAVLYQVCQQAFAVF